MDHPITVEVEYPGPYRLVSTRGTVRESPRYGVILVSFPDGGAGGRPSERSIHLDALTSASQFAIWDAKCHYIEGEE